jgi:phenylpropionate dioxygenase-like ring-hydroxylating dioxygenase large terminal subunit
LFPVDSVPPQESENRASGAAAFAAAPASWYYLASLARLQRGPVRFDLPHGQSFVGFCGADEKPAVLSARCAHMGADLALGCVRAGRLTCPLHGWEYGADGRCTHIPATAYIPAFARQTAFPAEVRGGHVFFFNRPQPRFPLPFFDGLTPAHLLAAPPFEFTVDAPWYLVGANGFDLQHFRCAHDRTLVGEPTVDSPHPFAWRLRAGFSVTGSSGWDRLTRCFSGSHVDLSVTNWGGNLVLVTARFRRTISYGIVSFVPLDDHRTLVRDLVWVPRSRSALGRRWFDPLDARIRRGFIREFVRSDVQRSAGLRFDRRRMIEADSVLLAYHDWLRPLHR